MEPTARHRFGAYHKPVIRSSNFPWERAAEVPNMPPLATSRDLHRKRIQCVIVQALLHTTTKAAPTSTLHIHSRRTRDTSQEGSKLERTGISALIKADQLEQWVRTSHCLRSKFSLKLLERCGKMKCTEKCMMV